MGPHFVDLTDLYSPRLRALCREVDPTLDEGVYVQMPGPHYETPAEIGMVRDARRRPGRACRRRSRRSPRARPGPRCSGISLVTNLAAGMTGEPLDHEEVLEAGRAAATRMGALLAQVVSRL